MPTATLNQRMTERLAQAFFDDHPCAALVVDATGRIVRANAAAAWLGADGEFPNFAQLTGTPWVDDDKQTVPHVGTERSRRLRVWGADGTSRLVDLTLFGPDRQTDAPPMFFCLLRDASPAIEAARVTQESESRSKVTTEWAPMLVWMAGPDMRCDWFNKPWLAFRNRSLGEELGDGWTEGVYPEDLERCLGVRSTSCDAREPYTLDYRLRRHDGAHRWMLETGVPRYGRDGEFLGYIGACLDITDRRDLEDKLAERTRTLRLSDQRREEFLAKLSHELRNPLAPIANAAAILHTLERDDARLRTVREIVERQVERLRRLITDLVDVTRVTKGRVVLQCEAIGVATLIESALDSVRSELERRRQTLRVAPVAAEIVCYGDPHRLSQALAALLSNATRFSPDESTIAVSTSTDGPTLSICVQDTGCGIAPEQLPQIFELFVQGDPSQAGLGVGLTIAKKIAQLHGGDVVLESPGVGRGAEATLHLPLDHPPRAGAEHRAMDAAELRGVCGQRVLIIEDNADARETLRLLLELGANEVMTAADAAEGLHVAELFVPQLVICDIGLPDIDGCELVRTLRGTLPAGDIRFIALTGYGRVEDRNRALESGFDSFLIKPLPVLQDAAAPRG